MERADFFQFTIEQALEMMLVFDVSGKILYANPAAERMLKYPNGLGGKVITEIFPMEEELRNVVEKYAAKVQQLTAYRGNRTCFPVNAKIVICPGAYQGSFPVYLCSANDISAENFLEKKVGHVEEEAKEAAKVKTEFVANVTHELRTPVNGILGNTQELLNMEENPNKIKHLHIIERGCRDMNTLINNILDFSKLEAGKFTLESRKFNFRNMIDYVRANHSSRMVEKGLDFSITVSPEIPQCVVGDELRIVQILNNLISNAYKFTSVGGVHVEVVKTAQTGKRAELFFIVMDSGIGIAKEKQDKLFKSFSQVDMSTTRKYGGTGLGLNICKQLVELMGGNIHVESDKGKGASFSFHIWVELPEDCKELTQEKENICSSLESTASVQQELFDKLHRLTENQVNENTFKYGTPENKKELQKKMSKLMLSVLMENWEKAEMLVETVKHLTDEAPKEIKSAAFRLKMAVQRGDTSKATECYERLQKVMEDINGSGE